jgi:hypothetical protein
MRRAMTKPTPMQTLYVLNDSDLHRVDAALGLLKQILEDIVEGRRLRVPVEPYSPGSLYELEEEAAQIHEKRVHLDGDF